MIWTNKDDMPKLDECLRHKEDGTLATVEHIATKDSINPPSMFPFCEHDVVMKVEYGITRICSGGPFFWTKWERIIHHYYSLESMVDGLRRCFENE